MRDDTRFRVTLTIIDARTGEEQEVDITETNKPALEDAIRRSVTDILDAMPEED